MALFMLELRTNLLSEEYSLPFTVYTAGMEQQPPISRMEGFSAHQLLITASGSGKVRLPGHHNWDILSQNTVLYIPAGFPNKYFPVVDGDWLVGFVSFNGSFGARASWGLGDAPAIIPVRSNARLLELLEGIWRHSGAAYDIWANSELLSALLTELRKQSCSEPDSLTYRQMTPDMYRETIVLKASKFIQDYMHRNISIAQLAEQVGYSQKQLTRLFLQTFQMTPLQYLRYSRLKAAQHLLEINGDMSVSQIARHVGMEAAYFTRMFRLAYGAVPSEYRKAKTAELTQAVTRQSAAQPDSVVL